MKEKEVGCCRGTVVNIVVHHFRATFSQLLKFTDFADITHRILAFEEYSTSPSELRIVASHTELTCRQSQTSSASKQICLICPVCLAYPGAAIPRRYQASTGQCNFSGLLWGQPGSNGPPIWARLPLFRTSQPGSLGRKLGVCKPRIALGNLRAREYSTTVY